MIPYSIALVFAIAFAASRALAMGDSSQRVTVPTRRFYSLILDPVMFLAVGFVAAIVGLWTRNGRKLDYAAFKNRKRTLDTLLGLFLLVFWAFEILTYFDVTVFGYHMGHPFDAAKTGNDFMWNGYLDYLLGPLVDTSTPTYKSMSMNLLACALLFLQYAALWLGKQLGYMTAFFNDLDRWTKLKR